MNFSKMLKTQKALWTHRQEPTPLPCQVHQCISLLLAQLGLCRPGGTRRAQPSLCSSHILRTQLRGVPELLHPALPPARDGSDHPAPETAPLITSCSSEPGGAVPRRKCPCWPLQQDWIPGVWGLPWFWDRGEHWGTAPLPPYPGAAQRCSNLPTPEAPGRLYTGRKFSGCRLFCRMSRKRNPRSSQDLREPFRVFLLRCWLSPAFCHLPVCTGAPVHHNAT